MPYHEAAAMTPADVVELLVRAAQERTPVVMFSRRILSFGALVVTLALGLAAAVPAADAQTPINIGTVGAPTMQGQPSVSVDQNGTAYAAWADAASGVVDFCVLPDGASACSPSGVLTPAAGAGAFATVQVLIDGGTVAILAEVGLPGYVPSASTPVQEWQAPDGTASFSLVNGGQSPATAVSSATPTNDSTLLLDGVVVPGTNVLGLDWFGVGGPPTFDSFPLSNPPQCSSMTQPACPFATLEPASNPDPVSNYSGSVGSQAGSNPGILGVYGTHYTTGPLACPANSEPGAAYVYGSGLQSPTNDYNVSPGSPNSAWKVAATAIPGDCGSAQWAVAGGPSGLGLLEDNDQAGTFGYRPFDQATMSFDKPVVPIAQTVVDETSLSQDAAGGIYATFNLNGPDGPVALAYSSDGGATWKGPAPLEPNPQFGNTQMTSSVGADGHGWAVYYDGGSVFALAFDAAASAASVAATLGNAPTTTSSDVVLGVKCFAVPCTVNTTLIGGGLTNAAHAARARATTLGSGTLRITRHGLQRLVIHVSKTGRRLLAAHHGQLKAILQEATTVGSYTEKNTLAIKIRRRPARR
jgi:hypothetical protein